MTTQTELIEALEQRMLIVERAEKGEGLSYPEPSATEIGCAKEDLADELIDHWDELRQALASASVEPEGEAPVEDWLPINTFDQETAPYGALIKAPSLVDLDFNPEGISIGCRVHDSTDAPIATVKWNGSHDFYGDREVTDATHWKPFNFNVNDPLSREVMDAMIADRDYFVDQNDKLKAQLAALSASPVQGWRDFATAPKNGQEILAIKAGNRRGLSCVIYWDSSEEAWAGRTYDDAVKLVKQRPTHWMPLPTPPRKQDGIKEDD